MNTMIPRKGFIVSVASLVIILSSAAAHAALALTISCAGVPSASNITWTGSASNGIAPIALLWGNGSTSTMQTIAVSPGTYSMALQATDASSTIATTTCSATVVPPPPSITSFIATPSSITNGQGSVLSWVATNASSTSLDNGIGAIAGTSITVTPSSTTTYHLSAFNPSGMTTASVMIVVNATSTSNDISGQIQNLLNQIAALHAQLLQLMHQRQSGGTATSTPPTFPPPTCLPFQRNLLNGNGPKNHLFFKEHCGPQENKHNRIIKTPDHKKNNEKNHNNNKKAKGGNSNDD